MNKAQMKSYRIVVAILFGLIGCGINFLDLRLIESPLLKVSLLLGLIFPLIITMSWGWRYGMISALCGGCQAMWWLWWQDGMGLIYSVPIFTLWILWHGWWADKRSEYHPLWQSSIIVEIPFRIAVGAGFYTLFPYLVSLNPPPWNPSITLTTASPSIIHTIFIKQAISAYILHLIVHFLLSFQRVRRFFGLKSELVQKEITWIYVGAIFVGCILWIMDAVVDYFIFNETGRSFWKKVLFNAGHHEMFMRLLFIIMSLTGAAFIAHITRRRAFISESLAHLNRVLSATRNVKKLIIHEKDHIRLLNETCQMLVETRGFQNAWIVLVKGKKPMEPFFQAGFDNSFSPMAQYLSNGNAPWCARKALETEGAHVLDDPSAQCDDCPMAEKGCGKTVLIMRIEHENHIFGWLSVAVPKTFAHDKEEQELFSEVGSDIGYALWTIETKNRHDLTEKMYTNVLASTSDAVIAMDLDCNISLFNAGAERLLKCPAREAIGSKITRFSPDKRLAEQQKLVNHVIQIGSVPPFETERLTPSGQNVPVEMSLSLFSDDKGKPIGVSAILRDITQRKKEEEEKSNLQMQLDQALRIESIGRLAGGVAHDLNNLLSPILGYGEMLLEETKPLDKKRDSIEQIVHAGMRARDLVSQLLAFSRKQTLKFKYVDLNMLLKKFEKLLRRTIREDITINLITGTSLPPIKGDIGQLEQVVMNLAINAQDAMQYGGKLIIKTALVELTKSNLAEEKALSPGPYVMLAISDTGFGMDMVTQKHIFEPFFTTKEKEKGTGLGLAMVYGIVKQHGGDIRVDSTTGAGSTFRIYLPITQTIPEPEKELLKTVREVRGSETILLAEDNDQVRNLAHTILEKRGYTVLVAESGTQALMILNEHKGPLDLLLTDVVMPEMNGRQLFDKASKYYTNLKVLYMSGYTDDVILHCGVMDKGIHFIQKPFSIKTLTSKVRDILDPPLPN